ncbi:MAG: FHA domain-containing protein [Actinobacteria bacterium]|nr:FHA domain-containing protein [Actinomycetota bacterium]
MALHEFERRLERLVEGVFAKAFRSGLQPVELVRRLTREMDLGRTRGVRGVIAPNYFGFALSPDDHERFQAFADVLARDLADAARDHARSEGYLFVGPVEVDLLADPAVSAGTFLLASEVREAEGGALVGTVVLPGGERVRVLDDAVTIGRLPECEVPLNDQNVSRRHAEVRREGDEFVVVDLGSTNGTKVNGTRVQKQRLNDGDEITVGSSTLRFEAS